MFAGPSGLLKAFLKALLKEFLKKKEPRSVENSVSYTRTRAREGHFSSFCLRRYLVQREFVGTSFVDALNNAKRNRSSFEKSFRPLLVKQGGTRRHFLGI